ncbi:hypothetical protein [Streptomyces sp. NPDC059786]|uniref:hypothetical protein n=1 Tax=Streptomyces sp. NPDC059786 TaxID=3346946 RepID=UPI00364AB992
MSAAGGERAPRPEDRDLAFGVEILGVATGEVVVRAVHECHVGVPVREQPGLLAALPDDGPRGGLFDDEGAVP